MSARDASDHVSNHCLKQIAFFYSGQFCRFLHTVRTCSILYHPLKLLGEQSGIDIELRILHMLFRSVRSPSTLPTAAIAGREPWPRCPSPGAAACAMGLLELRPAVRALAQDTSHCSHGRTRAVALLLPLRLRSQCNRRHLMQPRCDNTHKFWHCLLFPIQRGPPLLSVPRQWILRFLCSCYCKRRSSSIPAPFCV